MVPAILKGPGVQQMNSETTGLRVDCIYSRGLVFSAWTPSPEEMEMLRKGLPLWLIQRGPFIPEMTLKVGEQEEVIPISLMRDAITHANGGDPHERAVATRKADIRRGKQIMVVVLVLLGLLIWAVAR